MRLHSTRTAVATAAALALGLGLVGCAPAEDTTNSSSDSSSSSGATSGSTNDDNAQKDDDANDDSNRNATTERGADLATTEFAISWEDAVETAMGSFDGDLSEIELDWKRGGYTYSIELLSATEEYDVHINADTGDVSNESTEGRDDDDDDDAHEIVDLDAIVSWDDALAAALDAQQGTVTEWSLDGSDDEGPQFQFDIDDESGDDYEVTIDAMTGEVIEIDN